MIEVLRSHYADGDSAEDKLMLETLEDATGSHILNVHSGLLFLCDKIDSAAWNHDFTKGAYMEEFYEALMSGNIKDSKWYKMHISRERHHLLANPPEDVNLIDVLEHITDCVMAGLARSGEIYDVELPPELLQRAVKNTVELLKKEVKVIDE